MVHFCANRDCDAEFLYLHEGVLFVIELPGDGVEYYWLCPSCAPIMRVVCDASGDAKVVRKSEVAAAT